MLVCKLKLEHAIHHRRYVRSRSVYPIPPLKAAEKSEPDVLLEELAEYRNVAKTTNGKYHSWISHSTWQLIDQRAEARRAGRSLRLRLLGRLVKKALEKDRKARSKAAADAIESNLAEGKIRGAYQVLQRWFKDRGPSPPLPSRKEISQTRDEYVNLFAASTPGETPIPLHVEPFPINDNTPREAEIVVALRKLKNGKAAGATGIKAEDVKRWYQKAREPPEGEEATKRDIEIWEKVMRIIQLAFTTGEVPKAFCRGILILIPKSNPGEFRGIALLEIIYKLVSSLINSRIQSAVTLDDALHGFRPHRGTGTAIMETKLLMQLHCRLDRPLFMVFIDLKKAYDTLDRKEAMRILEGYGVGPNLRRIILHIWNEDTMVPRQSGYFGRPFKAKRGVKQGDIISPLIFNIMVDAVVRHWRHCSGESGETSLFYADDGMLAGTDPVQLQGSLDCITKGFASLGLKMNSQKTEFMIATAKSRTGRMSTRAYNRKITGDGPTFQDRAATKVTCINCGTQVYRQSLKRHQTSKKCRVASATYVPPSPIVRRVAEEQPDPTPVLDPKEYNVSIPYGTGGNMDIPCPVPGCVFKLVAERPSKRSALRGHFATRHMEDTIIIQEEGILPKCSHCGISGRQVETEKHWMSKACQQLSAKRKKFFEVKEKEHIWDVNFTVDNNPIQRVNQFKYLGRILDSADDDTHAALRQLDRARARWGRIAKVLTAEGATPKVMGKFYKAVVQTVLLYGSESWTISDNMMKRLRSFHTRIARYICRKHICPLEDGSWFYPSTDEVLESAGLETIDEYIRRRRETIGKYIENRPIFRKCIEMGSTQTWSSRIVWWKLPRVQVDLGLPGLSSISSSSFSLN